MRPAILFAALMLAGCGGKVFDLSADHLRLAAAELKAARDAGDLPPGDRWAECFDKVAARLDALAGKASAPSVPAPAVLLARMHIAKVQAAAPPDADCAQVRLELAHEAIKVGAGAFSGGGGGGVLDLLKGLPLPLP